MSQFNWRLVLLLVLLALLIAGLLLTLRPFLDSRLRDLISAVVISRLVDLANDERAQAGAGPLRPSPVLAAAARAKAADMARRGYFAHQTPEGFSPWFWLERAGYHYRAAGENLALNFHESELLNRAWMDSPRHRDNIMRPEFTEIGVGIARGEYHDGPAIFVVQYFALPAEE